MTEQGKSNIFPFFVLSVIIHLAVFYAFFYQAKKNVFIQIPVEVSFYSPVQEIVAAAETVNSQKTEEIKKEPEQKIKKEEIVINKKEAKKEEKKKKPEKTEKKTKRKS